MTSGLSAVYGSVASHECLAAPGDKSNNCHYYRPHHLCALTQVLPSRRRGRSWSTAFSVGTGTWHLAESVWYEALVCPHHHPLSAYFRTKPFPTLATSLWYVHSILPWQQLSFHLHLAFGQPWLLQFLCYHSVLHMMWSAQVHFQPSTDHLQISLIPYPWCSLPMSVAANISLHPSLHTLNHSSFLLLKCQSSPHPTLILEVMCPVPTLEAVSQDLLLWGGVACMGDCF